MNDLGRRLMTEVLDPLKRTFVGKDEIIDLMGICLVAGENLFILGPPGTAKTALVNELGRSLDGRTFTYLLTRFTEPNEIFGPFDIRRLREGDLVTNTDGMLPEASFVFLDEILNANSAILNSLLTVLNERVFRRGRETRAIPALMFVGASNRLPEDEALSALFDRFLIRVHCDNVPGERLGDVLASGWNLDLGLNPRRTTLGVEDVRALQKQLADVDLTDVRPAFIELIARLRQAGVAVSDRRAVKLQRPVAASALLSGRPRAAVSDLWVARHSWATVEQQEVIAAIVEDALRRAPPEPAAHPRARASEPPDPEALMRDLDQIAGRLDADGLDDPERAVLRDRLSILSGRLQWIAAEQQRTFLQERAGQLWTRLKT